MAQTIFSEMETAMNRIRMENATLLELAEQAYEGGFEDIFDAVEAYLEQSEERLDEIGDEFTKVLNPPEDSVYLDAEDLLF